MKFKACVEIDEKGLSYGELMDRLDLEFAMARSDILHSIVIWRGDNDKN